MESRKKLYYADNQIEKNLYTKGKEWMTLDDWKEYSGPYHRYITGEVFTEAEWNPFTSKKLVRYRLRSDSYFKYLDLKHFKVINNEKRKKTGGSNEFYKYKAPRVVRRSVTPAEAKTGVMNRYFIYKRNEPNRVFFEVDFNQVKDYQKNNSGINQYLYGLLVIPWKIIGPERDVFNNGLLSKPGVVDTNKRLVEKFSKQFRLLGQMINNYREFSQYDS